MRTLVLAILLAGCAYWTVGRDPVDVNRIDYVLGPIQCGNVLAYGCLRGPTIQVDSRLPPEGQLCVLTHEFRHAQGDVHTDQPTIVSDPLQVVIDCGNGTLWMGRLKGDWT